MHFSWGLVLGSFRSCIQVILIVVGAKTRRLQLSMGLANVLWCVYPVCCIVLTLAHACMSQCLLSFIPAVLVVHVGTHARLGV